MGARRSGDGETIAARCELKYRIRSKTYILVRNCAQTIERHGNIVRFEMTDGRDIESRFVEVLTGALDMSLFCAEDLEDSF